MTIPGDSWTKVTIPDESGGLDAALGPGLPRVGIGPGFLPVNRPVLESDESDGIGGSGLPDKAFWTEYS